MNARAKVAFAVVSILWGIPYLLIKIAVDAGISPACVAWVRVVLGATILLALRSRKSLLHSIRWRIKWLAAFALAEIVIPFPLIAAGERHVDSSVTAILIASAPLFVAFLALMVPNEPASTRYEYPGLCHCSCVSWTTVDRDQEANDFGTPHTMLSRSGSAVIERSSDSCSIFRNK